MTNLKCHSETVAISGTNYKLLKDINADGPAEEIQVSATSVGRKLVNKFVFQLTGKSKIDASTWTLIYRLLRSNVNVVAHGDIDIIVRKSDNTIRSTIATNVANSANISAGAGTYQTLTATYAFAEYTVVDQTDYLEIDFYIEVTGGTGGGRNCKSRYDDNALAVADQQGSDNVQFIVVVGNSITKLYDMIAQVARSHTHLYDLRQIAAKLIIKLYDLRQLAGKSNTKLYDLRQLAGKSNIHLYDMIAQVGKTIVKLYDLRQLATKTLTKLYDIRAIANKSITKLYDIRQLITNSDTYIYDIRQLTSLVQTHVYDILVTVTEVVSRHGLAQDIEDITAFVRSQRKVRVLHELTCSYSIKKSVRKSNRHIYANKIKLGRSITKVYGIEAFNRSEITCVYDINKTVGRGHFNKYDIDDPQIPEIMQIVEVVQRIGRKAQ